MSLVAHIHSARCCCSGCEALLVVFTVIMSESHEFTYTEESSSMESGSESSSSDEIEVVGIVQPYAEEPLAHSRKAKTMKLTKMVLLLPHYMHDLKVTLL